MPYICIHIIFLVLLRRHIRLCIVLRIYYIVVADSIAFWSNKNPLCILVIFSLHLSHVLIDYFGTYFCLSSKSVANIYLSFVFIYFFVCFVCVILVGEKFGHVFGKDTPFASYIFVLDVWLWRISFWKWRAMSIRSTVFFIVVVVGLLHHFQFVLVLFDILFDIFVFFFVE